MFFKILKKDLKRSKTMNIILFLFVILATIFVASGLNNLISVVNGMEYFLDEACGDKNDVFIIMEGKIDDATRKIFDSAKSIKSYDYDQCYYYNDIVKDGAGKKIDIQNNILISSPEKNYVKLFDKDNNVIDKIEKGHVYISNKYIKKADIEPGDKVTLKLGNEEKSYIVDGVLKDALFGADMVGISRFFMNDADVNEFFDQKDADNKFMAIVCLETNDDSSVKEDIASLDCSYQVYAASMMVTSRIVELMLAFIVVILSVCLIIVSFVILRFSIGFTIQDDFREIGVMKAIGIRNFKIRTLYMVKYFALAVVGAVVGLGISYPFGNLLIKSVSEGMLLGNSYGNMINIFGAVMVFAVIVWLAFVSTGRVKKMTPVDAIRSGETGERFRKKRGLRISRIHAKNHSYLSWNDIVSSPKRYINIIISFGVCTLFLLVLANFTATLDSPAFADALCYRADLYMDKEDISTVDIQKLVDKYPELENTDILDKKVLSASFYAQFENGKDMYADYLKMVQEKMDEEGMPAKVYNDIIYQYNFTFEGKEHNYTFQQVLGDRYGEYLVLEGSAPQNKNEIAITNTVVKEFGLEIGDTIEIDFGGKKEKCTVTAIYNCMNNMGTMIRLHDDAPTDMSVYTGSICPLISFTDNPSEGEIESRKERIKEIFDTDKVLDRTEEVVTSMGALDAFKAVEILFMAITVIVIILVTVMMERSFISKETKQIAILKAMGFRDGEVIKWQVIRFTVLAIIAVVIAMAISIPVTDFVGGSIFSSTFGVKGIGWVHNLSSMAKYPIILVAVTVFISWLTALYTGTVKARDTASIE
ncbi:MAG: ABC transporter permease [Eubacterium sp.]|nr:ABC transporter permease [Eubacterium sp.]